MRARSALRYACVLIAAFSLARAAPAEVVLSNGSGACSIMTSQYQLQVDTTSRNLISLRAADGGALLQGVAVMLTLGEHRFEWAGPTTSLTAGAPPPHLHTLRAGPHLVELCIENVVLTDRGETWPGLVELRLTCHESKVYLHARCLLPTSDWVNAGRFVYRRPQGHPASLVCSPTDGRVILHVGQQAVAGAGGPSTSLGAGPVFGAGPCLAIASTLPADGAISASADGNDAALMIPIGDLPWAPGAVREAACALLVAPDRSQAALGLDIENHPLAREALPTTMGECQGFDPRTGLYVFRAQTSPTPGPPRGFRAGAAFSVQNDDRRRTILVDSFDPWGGICGGIVRDGQGVPLPIRIQFGLNFPELAAEAGEPGWATLTFPLALAPGEQRQLQVEHLYGGAMDHDLLMLTSLENVGGPLLMQATVSRVESFTVTTGGELAINDFRRHYRDLKVRSVSAILPTFFGYYDAADRYHGLAPGEVRIEEAGPLLAEVSIACHSDDGLVVGEVRLWEVPCSDRTRLFADVALQVKQDVQLSAKRPAPLFLLRHHAFNPMAYRRFAAWVAPGELRVGELNFVPQVVANGVALGAFPFGLLYEASNPIDQGIPCSDISGNPGWVLLDAEARVNDKPLALGLYAFATGANDSASGDYARDLAVVPAARLDVLPAGTLIKYRALQLVFGDSKSDYTPMMAERQAWAVNPLRVEVTKGKLVSHDPPQLTAVRDAAQFSLSGGTDWMAVRVGGFSRVGRLVVLTATGFAKGAPMPHAREGEPWYVAWPDGGRVGYTFLVKLPGDGSRLRLHVSLAK